MKKITILFLSLFTFSLIFANKPSVIKKNVKITTKITNKKANSGDPIGPKNLYTLYAADCGYAVQFEAFSSLQASYILGYINMKCKSQKQLLFVSN